MFCQLKRRRKRCPRARVSSTTFPNEFKSIWILTNHIPFETNTGVFSIEFLTEKYDKFDPEKANKLYVILDKRFTRTNLFSQIQRTILKFHYQRKLDDAPAMYYRQGDIASMVYPWSRWSSSPASKHLDETWIASMKDLMTNYADTIVSNIVESYGAEEGGEKSKPPGNDTDR